MIKKRFYLMAGMLVLAGCQDGPSKEQQALMNSLIGKAEVDVVRAFGVPTRTFQASGHLFLAYIDNQIYYSGGYSGWGMGWGMGGWGGGWGGPGWGWGGGPGWGLGGGGIPPTAYNTTCQTTFELTDGKVTGWTVRGNGC
ncbi:hypothetical protein LOC54_06500 [Acetobacter sp. AN02]|uniref:hypothetical protein n=1 Tax=Acetobacter sp. AN02 TaxID=2894186 RepID=UPI0024342029|nr:hypothetical protein [Acetobacter sp. AN02]MDG6094760.1 hypothetical protein [Acetobacter sp. AN02]